MHGWPANVYSNPIVFLYLLLFSISVYCSLLYPEFLSLIYYSFLQLHFFFPCFWCRAQEVIKKYDDFKASNCIVLVLKVFGRIFRIFLVKGHVIYEQRRIHSFPTWDLFCHLGQAVLKPCWLEIDMLGPGKNNPTCPWYGAFQPDEESSLWVFNGGCSHVFVMDVVHLFLLQLVLASRRQY